MSLRCISDGKTYTKLATLFLGFWVGQSYAGDLDFSTTLNSTGYIYETQVGDNDASSNEAIVIVPSILSTYTSLRLSASFIADHTRVEQSEDLEGADKDFTELKYNSDLIILENSLFLSVNGKQEYRVVNREQEYVSDPILAAGDLSKFNSNSASINFVIPNPKHFGLSIQSNYSTTETEESLGGLGAIDGDNLAFSTTIYQGNSAENYRFDISGQYNDTSRTNLQDFESTTIQATIGFSIAPNYELILVGSSEDYDVELGGLSRRTNLDSSSYGAGFEWSPRSDRSINLTYNQLDEGENQTNFVGLEVNWALSSRTALAFDYSKKFYGDAYSLNFSHALKHLRSSIVYSEQVTSFSRFGTGTSDLIGLFVCQFGSTDLVDCFQPQSTDYQLQAGEEFRTLSDLESDISEEVLFTKSGRFDVSYDKRRVKVSFNVAYGTTEYLESGRIQTNRSMQTGLSYDLGRKSSLSFSAKIASHQFSQNVETDTTTTLSMDFKRDLSKDLKLTIGTRLLDRESDELSRNMTDKRLSLGLNYTF